MKKFLIRVLSFVGIPILILAVVYLVTDPFKTLKPFSFQYFDPTNRDYLTSEVFLRNDSVYHYNAFVFGSSRCNWINTWHWKHYLPSDIRQFMFQAWGETLTGIEQKIDYLDRNGNAIDYALVVLDIPKTFSEVQLSHKAMYIKHYKFSGQSKWGYQACLFFGFVQKPSKWIESIQQYCNNKTETFLCDTVTNDWDSEYRFADWTIQPPKDSLWGWSEKNRKVFLKQIEGVSEADLQVSEPLITGGFQKQLRHIKAVFDKHHTDYRIVISPAYCYTHPSISPHDLDILKEIFGSDRVYDYSEKSELTSDCYNFTDADHFGLSVGWQIIEEIYNK